MNRLKEEAARTDGPASSIGSRCSGQRSCWMKEEGGTIRRKIAYPDNLDFGAYSTAHFLTPRVKYFTKEMMDRLANMDKASYTTDQEYKFGETEIRHASETIYSRGMKYRQMLASMREDCNMHMLIEYINVCNEEHKRKMRTKHKAFADEQLKDINEYNEHVNSMLRTWATIGKVNVPQKGDKMDWGGQDENIDNTGASTQEIDTCHRKDIGSKSIVDANGFCSVSVFVNKCRRAKYT
ncbi:uncharacterized protein [Miscanthus floridulus]|uniref:uncharacterized protein isoform X2 n=1 Tax=Miscanthus floridulus TaxID=154761 RepID=UPI003458452E